MLGTVCQWFFFPLVLHLMVLLVEAIERFITCPLSEMVTGNIRI